MRDGDHGAENLVVRGYDPRAIVRRYPPSGVGLIDAHSTEIDGRFLVILEYADRLAVRSTDGEPITGWWDLQRIKVAIWGDRHAVEIFPPAASVIDCAPTRHLWWTPAIEREAAELSRRLHAIALGD